MKELGAIIILSGPPGSGKTTIGKVLAETANRSTVHLVTDNFYTAIKKGFIPPYLPEAAQQNETVIGAIVDSVLAYAQGNYDVIVDGIIGPWSLQPFLNAAEKNRLRLSFIILRPSLEQTLERAISRAGIDLKASGPIRGLYNAFTHLGLLEQHVIDSTHHTIDITVAEIRSRLNANLFELKI